MNDRLPLQAGPRWAIGDSPAATLMSLKTERCPPYSIQWMPPKSHCLHDRKTGRIEIIKVGPAIAELANNQLQEMRARAARGECREPFVDWGHRGDLPLGSALELFWGGYDPFKGGVRLVVNWNETARKHILDRFFYSFSPSYIATNDKFVGIGCNLGGVLGRNQTPGFRDIARIYPVTRLDVLREQRERFISGLGDHFQRTGIKTSALSSDLVGEAREILARARPDLFEAYNFYEEITKPLSDGLRCIS